MYHKINNLPKMFCGMVVLVLMGTGLFFLPTGSGLGLGYLLEALLLWQVTRIVFPGKMLVEVPEPEKPRVIERFRETDHFI